MSECIDLRSDTVTKPCPEMRRAIAEAEVGDDVFGEDPTVIALQEQGAKLLGKERALFVVSGTMANELAILSQTRRGDAVVADKWSHPLRFESGAPAVLSGVTLIPVDAIGGVINPADLMPWFGPPGDPHYTPLSLISIENPHTISGGAVVRNEQMAPLVDFAKERGLRLHLDGARLWNAAVALGEDPATLAHDFDTVSVCLSKGLGAPIGSLLAGDAETIQRAHRFRKLLGGGWRQAGILAAAGLYALNNNIRRLKDDHRRAQNLGAALDEMSGFALASPVSTNMIILRSTEIPPSSVVSRLREQNILAINFGEQFLRMVTHLEISDDDVQVVLSAFSRM